MKRVRWTDGSDRYSLGHRDPRRDYRWSKRSISKRFRPSSNLLSSDCLTDSILSIRWSMDRSRRPVLINERTRVYSRFSRMSNGTKCEYGWRILHCFNCSMITFLWKTFRLSIYDDLAWISINSRLVISSLKKKKKKCLTKEMSMDRVL